MDKQEILDTITRAQAKIDKAKVKVYKAQEELDKAQELLKEYEIKNAKEIKRWKPKDYEAYWFVNGRGQIVESWFTSAKVNDIKRYYETYNCFQTKKEAEQEAEKILIRRQLEDIAQRLNRGKEINWFHNDCKYYIIFDTVFKLIDTDYRKCHKIQGVIYCLDENFKDVAVEEIGEERLKKYLRG